MNAASSIHMSVFGMQPVVVHGSEELKRRTLPRIATGDLHVCFGVTEPGAGLDTTAITTFARRDGDQDVVNGRKVWISKAMESEKILLLTRTSKIDEVARKTDGMTLFLTDLDRGRVGIRPIPKMGRNAVTSNELFMDDLRVPPRWPRCAAPARTSPTWTPHRRTSSRPGTTSRASCGPTSTGTAPWRRPVTTSC